MDMFLFDLLLEFDLINVHGYLVTLLVVVGYRTYEQIIIATKVGFRPNVIQLSYSFCSHYLDKLASPGYILLPPRGIMYEAI